MQYPFSSILSRCCPKIFTVETFISSSEEALALLTSKPPFRLFASPSDFRFDFLFPHLSLFQVLQYHELSLSCHYFHFLLPKSPTDFLQRFAVFVSLCLFVTDHYNYPPTPYLLFIFLLISQSFQTNK